MLYMLNFAPVVNCDLEMFEISLVLHTTLQQSTHVAWAKTSVLFVLCLSVTVVYVLSYRKKSLIYLKH